jgi:DNA-binding response OmpR family regulator
MSAKIIIFNHSSSLLVLYKCILQRYDYESFVFQEQMGTLHHVEKIQPDLIILGNIRDESDGELMTLLRLKQEARLKQIPVIICTVSTQIQYDARVKNLDRVSVIAKPFLVNTLIEQVRQSLSNIKSPL